MSDEQIRDHDAGAHGSFEHEDLSPASVMYFMLGLGVVVIVIYFIVFGMYHFLDTYERAHQPAMSPLVPAQADTRTITHDNTLAFPQPRLEENERTQLHQFIETEDARLATYNWVDKDKGVVQIPIERAMDLVVQRGLPVRPGSPEAQDSAQSQDNARAGATAAEAEQAKDKEKRQSPKAAGKAAKHGE
jgi:hypothetical protein